MVKINLNYQGELRVAATHAPSQTSLITDAPLDNQGKGESFSPTDLVATGLGACMATVMGIASRKHNIDLKGMQIEVIKHMSSDAPRRIVALDVELKIPHEVEAAQKKMLEKTALECPVAQSIHPAIKVNTKFFWKKS